MGRFGGVVTSLQHPQIKFRRQKQAKTGDLSSSYRAPRALPGAQLTSPHTRIRLPLSSGPDFPQLEGQHPLALPIQNYEKENGGQLQEHGANWVVGFILFFRTLEEGNWREERKEFLRFVPLRTG